VVDEFVTEEQCSVFREAMDAMLEGSTHRGGYYLTYPETPQAKASISEYTLELMRTARSAMRLAVQQLYTLPSRVWTAGTLCSRAVAPAPHNGLDKDPMHNYSKVHVDKFNLAQYDWSALLYLGEHSSDFDGGLFQFVDAAALKCTELHTQDEVDLAMEELYPDCDADGNNIIPPHALVTVPPKRGRLLLFSASKDNPHRVTRVTRGQRHLLSVWFTSDPRYGAHD